MTHSYILSLYPEHSPLREVVEQYIARNSDFSLSENETARPDIAILDASLSFPSLPSSFSVKAIQVGGTLCDSIPISAYIPAPMRLESLWKKLEEVAASRHQEISLPHGYQLNPLARTLTFAGASSMLLHLTDKESALLLALHQAGEQGMDSTRLLSDVWGYNEGVDTHTVQTHIYRLRQKIEAAMPSDSPPPSLIETSETGYRLG